MGRHSGLGSVLLRRRDEDGAPKLAVLAVLAPRAVNLALQASTDMVRADALRALTSERKYQQAEPTKTATNTAYLRIVAHHALPRQRLINPASLVVRRDHGRRR